MYENINLWFAKDINNNIITIDEVDLNSRNQYFCPMCGSDLIPKALVSELVTAHFAHIDASKCNGESMIHFWFKNKFLEPGDKFIINSNEERQYICKEVLVEQPYVVGDKSYRPDVTVLTECGNTIYFEMDYSNKKKLQDYIDIWLELQNIVVEVDIKKLMLKDKLPVFKALFYDGKCFNVKKNDVYYNTIGKYKENIIKNINKVDEDLKARIQTLDWFWDDVLRFKLGELNIEYMFNLIRHIDNSNESKIIIDILSNLKCNDLLFKYRNYLHKEVIAFADRVIEQFLQVYNNSNINIFKKDHTIIIDNIYKTRDIIISFDSNSVHFTKKYYDDVEYKSWNGRKYKKYFRTELVKNTYKTYNINDFSCEDAIKSILEEINIQIHKSKRYA